MILTFLAILVGRKIALPTYLSILMFLLGISSSPSQSIPHGTSLSYAPILNNTLPLKTE